MSHNKSTRAGLGILIAFGLGLSGARAGAQTSLRYKFEQGEKLHYVMETKTVMKMSTGNLLRPSVHLTVAETLDISWNILSVDKAGLAGVTQKVERLRFVMDKPIGRSEYDSKAVGDPTPPRH